MSRLLLSLSLAALVFATSSTASACWLTARLGLNRARFSRPTEDFHRNTVQADTTETDSSSTDTTNGESESSEVTTEEQSWYDEMLKNEYVEADFAEVWKGMSGAERKAFYENIKKIEKESEKEAGKDGAAKTEKSAEGGSEK